MSPRPYVISHHGNDVAAYATIQEVIDHLLKKPLKGAQVFNTDRADGDCVDGAMVYYDGITDEEREAMEEAGVL